MLKRLRFYRSEFGVNGKHFVKALFILLFLLIFCLLGIVSSIRTKEIENAYQEELRRIEEKTYPIERMRYKEYREEIWPV